MLYSYKGQQPTSLPWRIQLPGGFTRTDPNTFSDEDLLSAGFTGPYTEPEYDRETHYLAWTGSDYLILPLIPENRANWGKFKEELLKSTHVNELLTLALNTVPSAAVALAPALMKAEQGDVQDFANVWELVSGSLSVSDEMLLEVLSLANDSNLPKDFIKIISPK